MQPYYYLLINLACISVPFVFSFYKKHAFYKQWKYWAASNILVGFVFLVWDELFTILGIWGFNPTYLTGIYLGHLPLEEILFFICIPYACSFTFFAYQYLLPYKQTNIILYRLNILMAIVLMVIGLVNTARTYTCITFISTGAFLLFLGFKRANITYYYLAFITILPFFFISNGILTGSFLEKPIVWYNNQENFGIRMFTIPVEDTFYGMLLIFANIYFQELFTKNYGRN